MALQTLVVMLTMLCVTPGQPNHAESASPGRRNHGGTNQGMVSIGEDGKVHKIYRLDAKVVNVEGRKREDTVYPNLLLTERSPAVRLIRRSGVWYLDRERKEDVQTATTVFEVKVTARKSGKVCLDLSWRGSEIEKAHWKDVLIIGQHLRTIQDIEVGKPLKLVYAKDREGAAQRWMELVVTREE